MRALSYARLHSLILIQPTFAQSIQQGEYTLQGFTFPRNVYLRQPWLVSDSCEFHACQVCKESDLWFCIHYLWKDKEMNRGSDNAYPQEISCEQNIWPYAYFTKGNTNINKYCRADSFLYQRS